MKKTDYITPWVKIRTFVPRVMAGSGQPISQQVDTTNDQVQTPGNDYIEGWNLTNPSVSNDPD